MGYDPMCTLNWGAFWKVAVGIAVAVVAVTVAVASGRSALAIGTALVGGYAIGSNVATVIESNIYVKNNKTEAMSESEFESVNSKEKTIGLSRVEKLQYIRYIRGYDSTISNNWSESQMLREIGFTVWLLN
jgi:uncharacterized protein YdgA (DUF945 family)